MDQDSLCEYTIHAPLCPTSFHAKAAYVYKGVITLTYFTPIMSKYAKSEYVNPIYVVFLKTCLNTIQFKLMKLMKLFRWMAKHIDSPALIFVLLHLFV